MSEFTEYNLRPLIGVNINANMQGQVNFVDSVIKLENVEEAILTTGPFPGVIVVMKETKMDNISKEVHRVQSVGVEGGVGIQTSTGYLVGELSKQPYKPTSFLIGFKTNENLDGQIAVARRIAEGIPYVSRVLLTAGPFPDIIGITDAEQCRSKTLPQILRDTQGIEGVIGTSTGSFVYQKKK